MHADNRPEAGSALNRKSEIENSQRVSLSIPPIQHGRIHVLAALGADPQEPQAAVCCSVSSQNLVFFLKSASLSIAWIKWTPISDFSERAYAALLGLHDADRDGVWADMIYTHVLSQGPPRSAARQTRFEPRTTLGIIRKPYNQ